MESAGYPTHDNLTTSQRFGRRLLSTGAQIAFKRHNCESLSVDGGRMITSIGFYLSALIAAGIIFIGCRFLLAPSTAATAYGVPAGAEPHSRAYLSAKGIRDIASGLFVAILMAYGSAHVLGWFMLAATLIPVADAV